MHLKTRNVNMGFRTLVEMFNDSDYRRDQFIIREPYSNPNGSGFVLRINEPVLVTYTHPRERVLFNKTRDANPFFHMYEALWMLAGRNDLAPLRYYNSQFTYSDDGETVNGAYGYRWRMYPGPRHLAKIGDELIEGREPYSLMTRIDQLNILVSHLQRNPTSRRAVLSMWNVEDDLLKIDTSRDVACNLNVMFSLSDALVNRVGATTDCPFKRLDMTVTNRSNDLVLGMLGANYVHFSMLQEYMANRLGVEVGVYNQFTNNLHVYEDKFKPDEWLSVNEATEHDGLSYPGCSELTPLRADSDRFDNELCAVVEEWSGKPGSMAVGVSNPFLMWVAQPMFMVFQYHKAKKTDQAIRYCDMIQSDDWKIACTDWLLRRRDRASNRT